VLVHDTDTGKLVSTVKAGGDSADLFHDGARRRSQGGERVVVIDSLGWVWRRAERMEPDNRRHCSACR